MTMLFSCFEITLKNEHTRRREDLYGAVQLPVLKKTYEAILGTFSEDSLAMSKPTLDFTLVGKVVLAEHGI